MSMGSIVGGQYASEIADENPIVRPLQQKLFVHALQECLRTLPGGIPQTRMQTRKQRAGGTIPAIPKVVCEFIETRQAGRNFWTNLQNIGGTFFHGFNIQSIIKKVDA